MRLLCRWFHYGYVHLIEVEC